MSSSLSSSLILISNSTPQDHVYELLNTIDACQCHFDIVRFFAILLYPRAMEMVSVGTVWGEMGLEEWLLLQHYNVIYSA